MIAPIIAPLERKIDELAVDHNLSNYDIWTETGRSEIEQKEFKDNLLLYYKRRGRIFNDARCMVTNEWHPRQRVIAEHIWKNCMHGSGLHKFNLERADATSPRNGLLVLKDIEDQFTTKHICFVYNAMTREFIVKVLDPSLRDKVITHSLKTFGDIHNTKLHHPADRFPFRRILSFHARCSYKFAREKGWITREEEERFEPYHNFSDSASIPEIDMRA